MAVRIRLKRTGRKNLPSFRICVFDGRTRRDGPPIEILGWFNPLMREAGKGFKVQSDRVEHWIGRGAKMTLAVTQLLGKQGVKLNLPAKAPAAASGKPPAKRKSRAGKPDPKKVERRKRKLLKRASRRAHLVKKAAAAAAGAEKKAAAPAGKA